MTYPDLHDAIGRHALIRAREGLRITQTEQSGKPGRWVFDFRALMLQPHWLDRYAEIFFERYGDRYPFQVCGMETAGIALVAAIVMKSVQRGMPVNGFYLRKSRKRYNLMKQVEGVVTDDPVIVVDDLVNFGTTLGKQFAILSELGATVTDAFCLLRFRDEAAYTFAADRGIRLLALYSLEDFSIPLMSASAPEVPRDSFDVVWRFQAPDPSLHLVVHKSSPVLDDTRVFFGTDAGVFYALRQDTGAVVWQHRTVPNAMGKGILSSPALHGTTVYFGAYDGTLYALDTGTGKPRWTYTDADWIGSSPSLAPDLGLLFIGLEFGLWRKHGGIAALDLETGKEVWKASHPELTHGSPLYIKEEHMVVIGSNDHAVYAHDAKTGALLWRYLTDGDIKMQPAYDAKRRLVLVPSMDGKLYALAAKTGLPSGAFETGGGIYSTPLVDGDTAYVASLDKKLYAVDLDTFERRWAYETAGRIFSSPVRFENHIWVGSNDGRLYQLQEKDGTLAAFFQATERIVTRIAYNPSSRAIFMGTVANEMYCLRRRSH